MTSSEPIALEQHVRFDSRRPMAVHLETTLPGQTLLIGLRAGQSLRAHRVDTPIAIHVLRGEGTLAADETTAPARPGTLLPMRAAVMEAEIVPPERIAARATPA